ncbi:uncharacterized protein [Rhodnius prolixus]|uniref:uncharacterized protein n=1 Tax=Rhodnius prolixus TaxID=13249 RepID=UPI003D18846A
MSKKKNIFITEDEIMAEFLRHKTESDGESVEETCPEEHDGLLSNDDNQDDVFDAVGEDVSYSGDEEDKEERNVILGKNKSKFFKTPKRNIVTHLPGQKGEARELFEGGKLFSLFVADEMISSLVCCTNKEIEMRCEK